MQQEIIQLKEKIINLILATQTLAELAEVEVRLLGRKSELADKLRMLGTLPAEQKKDLGILLNKIKQEINQVLQDKQNNLEQLRLGSLSQTDRVDVTLPGLKNPRGHLHLVSQAIFEISDIFARIGFRRARYPEVEWDYYAFEALNMPSEHPARDEWETFFMDAPVNKKMGKMILTPHTSSGQIREMLKGELPIRMINIAKTYRRQIDLTHVPMFHQMEGLMIDEDVSITNLKGVIDYFAKSFFGPERITRLRPFHFRFTEPSFEIDINCGICGGSGRVRGAKCRVCKQGWLELAGAGLVHPNVLKAGGVDFKKYGGFAFGWGVERVMTTRSGIKLDDLRDLYRNDFRFLEQF